MTTHLAEAGAFSRAVARRLAPGRFVMATLTLAMLIAVGAAGIMTAIWSAPPHIKLARAVEFAVMSPVIVLAVAVADELVARGVRRAATYAFAVVTAAAAGALLGWEVRGAFGLEFLPPPGVAATLHPAQPYLHRLDVALAGTVLGGLATFVHANRQTALAARRRQHEAEQARARARRRTLESELQALQARVEPMFLFATLARIRDLYRSDAAAASEMLDELIVYLRSALPHLRESTSTVGQETMLARSWLAIVGRATRGWRVEVDVDDAAREARLPALVLLPLVQQAVAEAPAGLRLRLVVRADGTRLSIMVATSAPAFAAGIAGRPVLEQIGERLHALHEDDARLICGAVPDGSEARIELPLEHDSRAVEGAAP
jgi:hypothetical protein